MRKARLIVFLLIIINLLIALNRNNGFQFVSSQSMEELYPEECDYNCLSQWSSLNNKYTNTELAEGLFFLENEFGITKSESTEIIITKLVSQLYLTYKSQIGAPSEKLNRLFPLKQLQLLSKDSTERLWCGNFQSILGYFFSALDLPNRYVEITSFPGSINGDTHEVNEVYIKENKKWIMTDATRNIIFIKRAAIPFSTAEYLNFKLSENKDTVQIYKSVFNKTIIFDTLLTNSNLEDIYFNKNYFLRYYYMVDLKKVYSPVMKIKRYLFPDPWFTIYDPQNNYSNVLFRIKQFFIFLLGLFLIFYLFLFLKIKFLSIDRSKKYL